MRTFDELFDTWDTLTEMAADVGSKQDRVEKWRKRRQIPHKHWPSLIDAARRKGKDLSADDLLAMHFPKRRRNGSAERIRA